MQSSISLSFSDLFWGDDADHDGRLPISTLPDVDEHIHGHLEFRVQGRLVPDLDVFGPDRVCFTYWIPALQVIAVTLTANDPSSYWYCYDQDQHQPAFLFERSGAAIFLSVIEQLDYPVGFGGHPDSQRYPDWLWVEADLHDFIVAVDRLVASFRQHLEREIPELAERWFQAHR